MNTRVWHKGPPPHIGWWNASNLKFPDTWRWWNGESWSFWVSENSTAQKALECAAVNSLDVGIYWTFYWPENARAPRVAPGVVTENKNLPHVGMRDGKYVDSTPLLNVGSSSFEDWFQWHPRACEVGIKQMARDAYAAGMGDPLVTYANTFIGVAS